jgi:hypothetical protein
MTSALLDSCEIHSNVHNGRQNLMSSVRTIAPVIEIKTIARCSVKLEPEMGH